MAKSIAETTLRIGDSLLLSEGGLMEGWVISEIQDDEGDVFIHAEYLDAVRGIDETRKLVIWNVKPD